MRKHIITTAIGVTALTAGVLGGTGAGFGIGRTTAPTPEACLVALDEGERALSLTSDALSLAGEAVVAAASWDVAEVNRITDELDDVNAQLGDGQTYIDAKAECRGEPA
ncbi:MAG: hypothetical protein L0G94_10535 [Brachybacterium sp.]|uniref:hypothetical protein n=1 Tax=Brachybacterium sp. TaxID=1891286 RepID=UPI00264A4666|nr:hypothetical protein [Brachybacterium sp.]MDN5687092.1 hypothetical protein [Brachybacterium sp.]